MTPPCTPHLTSRLNVRSLWTYGHHARQTNGVMRPCFSHAPPPHVRCAALSSYQPFLSLSIELAAESHAASLPAAARRTHPVHDPLLRPRSTPNHTRQEADSAQLQEHEQHRDHEEGHAEHEDEARKRVEVNIGIVGVVVVVPQSAEGAQADVPGVDDGRHCAVSLCGSGSPRVEDAGSRECGASKGVEMGKEGEGWEAKRERSSVTIDFK